MSIGIRAFISKPIFKREIAETVRKVLDEKQGLIEANFKIGIFGRDHDEAKDQPGGILKYVEDLKRGSNADIGRKDYFGMLLEALSK